MNQLLNKKITNHEIDFSTINAVDFKNAFDILLPEVKIEHEDMLNKLSTYDNIFESLEKRDQLISLMVILSNLNSVVQTPEIREVYNEYIPTISTLFQELSLDKRVYDKIKDYTSLNEYLLLDELQRKIINNILLDLELGGIALPEDKKIKLQEISFKLSELKNKYDDNLTDVESNLEVNFTKSELKGVSDRVYKNAKIVNENNGDAIYNITYSSGLYGDIMANCDISETKKIIYNQMISIGTKDGFDNRLIVDEIVSLSHEKAIILGSKNYAEYALIKNMVKSSKDALSFINNLQKRSYDKAIEESKSISSYGQKLLGKPVEFHERSYVVNSMEKNLFNVNHDKIREYFPVKNVINGLFKLLNELYDISFKENKETSKWHEDVIVYDVVDNISNKNLGILYMDLYKRKFKSNGAWMNPVLSKHHHKNTNSNPVVYIVSNAPKNNTGESTFEFDEIITLFHEMGHALHHILTEVPNNYYSGINNVQLDAVELPSQFMENFCWDYEILKDMSSHILSGEKLPIEIYNNMYNMKNFLSASQLLRQSINSEIDMRIYSELNSNVAEVEKEVFTKWKTRELDPNAYLTPSFSHIFSSMYSAGYYSYKWAEVLSADCFAAIKDEKDNKTKVKEVATRYRKNILATGGSNDMLKNFIEFRGREPDIKYLLDDSGINVA